MTFVLGFLLVFYSHSHSSPSSSHLSRVRLLLLEICNYTRFGLDGHPRPLDGRRRARALPTPDNHDAAGRKAGTRLRQIYWGADKSISSREEASTVVLYSHITFKIDLIIEPLKKRRLLCSEEIHETSKALIQAFPPHHKATKLYS